MAFTLPGLAGEDQLAEHVPFRAGPRPGRPALAKDKVRARRQSLDSAPLLRDDQPDQP